MIGRMGLWAITASPLFEARNNWRGMISNDKKTPEREM